MLFLDVKRFGHQSLYTRINNPIEVSRCPLRGCNTAGDKGPRVVRGARSSSLLFLPKVLFLRLRSGRRLARARQKSDISTVRYGEAKLRTVLNGLKARLRPACLLYRVHASSSLVEVGLLKTRPLCMVPVCVCSWLSLGCRHRAITQIITLIL